MSSSVHSEGCPMAFRYTAGANSVEIIRNDSASSISKQEIWKKRLWRFGILASLALVVVLVFVLVHVERSARKDDFAEIKDHLKKFASDDRTHEVVQNLRLSRFEEAHLELKKNMEGKVDFVTKHVKYLIRDHWQPNSKLVGFSDAVTRVQSVNGFVFVSTAVKTDIYRIEDYEGLVKYKDVSFGTNNVFAIIPETFIVANVTEFHEYVSYRGQVLKYYCNFFDLDSNYPVSIPRLFISENPIKQILPFSKGVAFLTQHSSTMHSKLAVHLYNGTFHQLVNTISLHDYPPLALSSNGNLVYRPSDSPHHLFLYNVDTNSSRPLIDIKMLSPEVLINDEGTSAAIFELGRLRVVEFSSQSVRLDQVLDLGASKLIAFANRFFAFASDPCSTACNITIAATDNARRTLRFANAITEPEPFFEHSFAFRLINNVLHFHYVTKTGVLKLSSIVLTENRN